MHDKEVLSKIVTKSDLILINVPIFADSSFDRALNTKIYVAIEYILLTMKFDKPLV